MLLIPSMMLFLKRPTVVNGVLMIVLLVTINSPQEASLAAWLAIPLIYAVRTVQLPYLPRLKWFFYGFYPGHLLILWLLKTAL